MEAILRERPGAAFGEDPFNPHRLRPVELVRGKTQNLLRQQVAGTCPRVPGVYGMLDRKGELIYVGKSKSLRSRLLSYFSNSAADDKGGRIIEQARAIRWETQPSDFAALVREQVLIRRWSPRWNVQGVPQRQRPVFLCLGRRPFPTFYLSSTRPRDCVAVEGPFYGSGRMVRTVEALNKVFQLRDCSQKQVFQFAEQLQLFDLEQRPGCLRLELGTCLGPCAAACRREQYESQVAAAASFMEGINDEPIDVMREQMRTAATNRQYELAGRARDALKTLEYVQRKLGMFASARREYSFIYAAPGYDGCGTWYLIRHGELSEVAAAPRNAEDYAALKPTLRRWAASLAGQSACRGGENPHTVALVAAWFRKHPTELQRTFAPEQAGRKYFQKSMAALAS